MIQSYDGTPVCTVNGDQLGTVERSFDDSTGAVQFVEVKIGTLFAKHRLIPTDGAEMTNQGLKVPYSKQIVENSPDASSVDQTLQGALLDQVRSYYSAQTGRAEPSPKQAEHTTQSGERPAAVPLSEVRSRNE